MLNNRDRRNGLVFTGASRPTYGKHNNKRKARYNLSDIVLEVSDSNTQGNGFDISNDSFQLSDDEFIGNDDDSLNQDIDIPYAKSSIINIPISDDENDYIMGSPDKGKASPRSPVQKRILQDISPVLVRNASNILANDINEKRIPLNLSNAPVIQRNNSSGLSHLRSSLVSNNSKRWSLLSFNSEDKENISSIKSKRFSIASTQSTSSKDKSKRYSVSSQQSVQSSSSSFKKALNKVSNVLSSVSVASDETSAESTPYKNVKPGVVGENKGKRSSDSANLTPISLRTYNQIIPSQPSVSTSVNHVTSLRHTAKNSKTDDSDNVSLFSTGSTLRSSRSKFRLSSLFTSSKKDPNDNDNISVRSSVRGRNSLNDMRKSVLSMSTSTHSLFRLHRKESISEISLDKTMISLPRPDNDSRFKLKNKLRNSSSVLSINSVASRQPTIATINTSISGKSSTTVTTALPSDEYESCQLQRLVSLTTHDAITPFKKFIDSLKLKDDEILIKFSEASFSEVYILKDMKTNANKKIFKVIPFGDEANGQPSIDNIIQELKINLKLSNKEGFIHLNDCVVVKGAYPNYLLKLWDDYNELKESNNYRPEHEESQKYLILDLEYGGIDLEKFKITSWTQSLKIFWETVKILNQVEQSLKFEHRDLHWGNIVINYKDGSTSDSDIDVKIIDYTLSRLNDEKDQVIFTRLDHQDFFKGRGDYQFDIYRFMRNEIKSLQKDHTQDVDWSLSSFKNNLYWLHYILDKLINAKKLSTGLGSQEYKTLQYLYKSLDPRRKKLNGKQVANYKLKQGNNKKRQLVYFQDFDNCQDLIEFGEFYGLIL